MAKTKAEKESDLSALNNNLAEMKSAVIVDYKGLKVKDTEALRKTLRAKSIDFKVAKLSLLRLALKNQGLEVDEAVFKKPIAVAFGMADEVDAAKEIDTFAKTNENLEILGGILEKKFIGASAVKQLASLPGREQLYGQVVGTIAAPLSGMVNVLAGNIRSLVNVLNNYKESK